jgi:hypothetical protein
MLLLLGIFSSPFVEEKTKLSYFFLKQKKKRKKRKKRINAKLIPMIGLKYKSLTVE